MDRNGNSIAQGRTGRLMAVLWIITAAFAMQLVASAQVISSRFSTQQGAGNFSASENGTTDTTLSRHAIRALPADLRFIAERGDGKFAPGGPEPFILAELATAAANALHDAAAGCATHQIRCGLRVDHALPRGPPSARA